MISVSTGGVKDCAVQLQLTAELEGVAQVAVVGQGHFALLVVPFNGLAVGPVGAASGAVAHMAHGHGPQRKLLQVFSGKDLVYETQILVRGKRPSSQTTIPQLSWPRCCRAYRP